MSDFTLHPDVSDWIYQDGGGITVNGTQIYDWVLRPTHDPDDRMVYDAVHWTGSEFVLLVSEFFSGSPQVRVTAVAIRGHVGNDYPVVLRSEVEIAFTHCTGQGYLDKEPPGGWEGDEAYAKNGQGTGMIEMLADISLGTAVVSAGTGDITSSDYVPRYATKTGGDWPYMGARHFPNSDSLQTWKERLYPLLSYPGWFMLADGRPLEEADMPDVVITASGNFHDAAADTGPLNYDQVMPNGELATAPWDWEGAPDKVDGKQFRAPDDQHLTVYSAPAEAADAFPTCEGFRLLALLIANRFPLQMNDVGPQSKIEVDRGAARPLMVACDLWMALGTRPAGDGTAHHYATAMAERAQRNGLLLLDIFDANPEWPWDTFGGIEGRASTAETGLVWWALEGLRCVVPIGDPMHPRINAAQAKTARFCFDAFQTFPNGEFGVPYWVHQDGSNRGSASGSDHFCYAGARACEIDLQNPEEVTKMQLLEDLESGYEAKWRPPV